MSSIFTLLHLDYISCLLVNKKYYSKFTSLEIFSQLIRAIVSDINSLSIILQDRNFCFLFLQQQKAGERKKFVPIEYVTVKRKVKGGGEP